MSYIKLLFLLTLFSLPFTEAMLIQSLSRGTGAARGAFPGFAHTMRQPASRFSQKSMVRRFMHTPVQLPTTVLGRMPSWTPTIHGFWRNIGDRFSGLIQSNNAGMTARNIAIPKGESSSGWSARAAAMAAIAGYGAAKSLMSHDRVYASDEIDAEKSAAADKIVLELWNDLGKIQKVQAIIDHIPADLEALVVVKAANMLLEYINNSPYLLSTAMYWYPDTVNALISFLIRHPYELIDKVPEAAKLINYLLTKSTAKTQTMLKKSIDDNQEVIAKAAYGKQVLAISGIVPYVRVSLSDDVDNSISPRLVE